MEKSPGKYGKRTLFLFILLFFAVWSIRATFLSPYIEGIENPLKQRIVSDSFRLLFFVLPVFFYLHYLDAQDPLLYLKLSNKPNLRQVLAAGGVLLAYFVIMWVYEFFSRQGTDIDISFGFYRGLQTILFMTIVPFAEEVLFRGFLLQKFMGFTRFAWANVLSSFLFAAIHLPYWLFTQGFSTDLLITLGTVFLLGLFLGYGLNKSGSLWVSIAAHAMNNLLGAILIIT